jgi:hypothetical protein
MSAQQSFHFRITDDATPGTYIGNIIASTMFRPGDEIHLSQFSTNTSIPKGLHTLIVKDVQPEFEGTEKRERFFAVVAEWKRA